MDALNPLPPADLPRQWVLADEDRPTPDGWPTWRLGGLALAAHPDARVRPIRSETGKHLGWAVEALVQVRDGHATAPGAELALPVGDRPEPDDVERALYGRSDAGGPRDCVEGPWTVVLVTDDWRRLYLSATHSVVYCPDRRTVATTHNLIPGLSRDVPLSEAFDPLARNGHYAFGLTAFEGLRRLLPNHFLDLDTFAPRRHWPIGPPRPAGEGPAVAAQIVGHARDLVGGLLDGGSGGGSGGGRRCWVSLSAGRDSRAVLAVMRPFVASGAADLGLTTTYGDDVLTQIDRNAAKRLAKIAGLPIELKRRRPRDVHAGQVRRMFVRVGEAYAGPIFSAPGLHDPSRRIGAGETGHDGQPPWHLPGMAGEVGRAYYWADEPGGADAPVDAGELVRRLKCPAVPAALDAAQGWLNDLPPGLRAVPADVWDLAYVEQRLGCWQSPGAYLFPGRYHSFNVFAAARNVELMLGLPAAYRAGGTLQRDMVAHGWPALLAVDFNRPDRPLALKWAARRQYRRLRGLAGLAARALTGRHKPRTD